MQVDIQNNYSKSYSLKHSSKKKEKSREEECKHKITRRCVIEEEEEFSKKPLRCPPSDKSIH